MNIISLIKASKDYGIKPLFNELSLHIGERERLGLIGPNGAGKSTLLKVLAGIEPLRSGERRCSGKITMKLVSQEFNIEKDRTILEEVLKGCGEKRNLLIRFKELSAKVSNNSRNGALLNDLGRLTESMDRTNAWQLEQECQKVLDQLGINDLERPISELSGGYRKRVGLASALVTNPDLLLLDEPTNHLDASGVEWLQEWLKRYSGALVIITHDRYFLDRITNKIIEIDQGNVRFFEGNYNSYLKQKIAIRKDEESKNRRFQTILRNELEWLKKGPKARSTKQKARLKRIEEMKEKPKRVNQKSIEMKNKSRRIGNKVIEAENIFLTSSGSIDGETILRDFTYSFSKEDRVGIIGANGSGKSTLLDVISGRKNALKGELNIGETIELAYLKQHNDNLNFRDKLDLKVIDFIEEEGSFIKTDERAISASQLLERFLFSPPQQHVAIKKLSGGERRRLILCRMLMKSPNVLLLDEPTNDLDINTLTVLEDYLEDFIGCVIIVSHDRYFLDRTVDRIFHLEGEKLKQYEGNYTAFLEKSIQGIDLINSRKKKDSKNFKDKNRKQYVDNLNNEVDSKKRKRISYKEKIELKKLEENLSLLNTRQLEIEEELSHGRGDLSLASKKLAKIVAEIKELEDRWIELSELDN